MVWRTMKTWYHDTLFLLSNHPPSRRSMNIIRKQSHYTFNLNCIWKHLNSIYVVSSLLPKCILSIPPLYLIIQLLIGQSIKFSRFSEPKFLCLINLWTKHLFGPPIFRPKIFFHPKLIWTGKFYWSMDSKLLCPNMLSDPKFLEPTFFGNLIFLTQPFSFYSLE